MRAHFSVKPESQEFVARLVQTSAKFARQADRALGRIAEETAAIVRDRIARESFEVVGLSAKYVLRKRRQGLDPRVLVATLDYMNSIGSKRIGKGVWGVTADVEKAVWAEYGSPKQKRPARPHWIPTLIEMEKIAPEIFSEEVFKGLFGG